MNLDLRSYIDVSRVVDVADWDRAEEVPTGSREKVTVIEPETGRHHIHKFPKVHREHQLWSELLASYIAGDLLGWEVQHRLKDEHLEKQRQNGCHHLRLDGPAKRGGKFEDVCIAFLQHYPGGKHWFEAAEGVDIDAVCRLMDSISERMSLSEPHSLSERRRQHIYAMLQIGVERIRNVLCRA